MSSPLAYSSSPPSQTSTNTAYGGDRFASDADSADHDPDAYPDIYRGNVESTWRKRNADVLLLASSLDKLRNQDLSVHLYNAFKLSQVGVPTTSPRKRRKLVIQAKPGGFGAAGSEAQDEDVEEGGRQREREKDIWRPPKSWTAWPLPPDIVPREKGYEPGATQLNLPKPYVNIKVKGSEWLEEVLLAHMLKRANATLRSRNQERSPGKDFSMTEQERAVVERRRRPSSSSPHPFSPSTISSPPLSMLPPRSRASSNSSDIRPSDKLSILSDDDGSLALLQPSIRAIITNLNTLLSNLHQARATYASVPADRDASSSATPSKSRSRGRRAGTPAPTHRHRRKDEASGDTGSDKHSKGSDGSDGSEGGGGVRRRNFSSQRERSRKRKQKLGLMGWEDVMGLAAVGCLGRRGEGGWDRDAVKRAGERCVELFNANGGGRDRKGEGMSNAMAEGGEGQVKHGGWKELLALSEPIDAENRYVAVSSTSPQDLLLAWSAVFTPPHHSQKSNRIHC